MKQAEMLLKIAKDEAQTLADYQNMLDSVEDLNNDVKAVVDEIMGDEFNHCLISLLSAAKILDIKIATDEIQPDPNSIEVN